MKLNINKAIKGLDGADLVDEQKVVFTIGKALSNILLNASEGGKMKMFILAQKCYGDKEIEIDISDLSIIKMAIEQTKLYNNLVNGQILIMLGEIKE